MPSSDPSRRWCRRRSPTELGTIQREAGLSNLYALDGNGQEVWTTTLGGSSNGGGISGQAEKDSMAVAEGTLFVPAGNVLEAFR